MEDQIFILNSNDELIELNESKFKSELIFQELLENYPNLISGSQIDPDDPRRWILISREVGIPKEENGSNIWSIDHLFLDQDGIPTLVEVKRSTDRRIRREVVGQMLDYAANCVKYWTIAEIRNKYEEKCRLKNLDVEAELSELLGAQNDSEKYWEKVDVNLKAGKIRLLFIADSIPKELQRIIEFLNEQMSPAEVLGVEIKQFANNKLKTLVPRVIGKTTSADIKKGQNQFNKWDEESFYHELSRRNSPKSVDIIKYVLDNLKNKVTRFWYGQGKNTGTIIPVLDKLEYSNQLFAIYTYGKIEIYFQYIKAKPPFDDYNKRKLILEKLNKIGGINLSLDKLDKRPSFEINALDSIEKQNKFLKVFDWIISELNKSQK